MKDQKPKNKILILGMGFIGKRLQEELHCNFSNKKIYSFRDAEGLIKKYRPNIIINCIGNIKGNVDKCEINKDKTLFANTYIPILLAEVALRNRVKLVHISSGCIYNYNYFKNAPIKETKIADFFGLYYSRSKVYADRALEYLSDRYNILIIRTRIPLDCKPHPKNLLTKLIGYKKIINLPNSVIYLPDFILALKHLLKINAKGIYNVVNKGGLVYSDLLNIYKRFMPNFEYAVIDYKDLHLVRTNLILSTEKLERAGFKIRKINDVLDECVKKYLKYL